MGVPNWANQSMWTADNLPIMRGMNTESVDLIYLDPPFNSDHNYAAPIGSKAAGAAFKDTWGLSDIDLAWLLDFEKNNPDITKVINATLTDSDKAYLIYMAPRLLEMRRLLKPTGSIYLHCDPTMSHYLKLLMDAIYGRKNFQNEIIWCYSTSGRTKRFFARKHDTILLYTASSEAFWGDYRIPVSPDYLASHYRQKDEHGRICRIREDAGKVRVYYPEEGMICNDWWEIPYVNSMSKERTGYPTQKPLTLLRRIIEASSKEGDIVLDPFCGCATACVAANDLERQWVGIDISPKAYELVRDRIQTGGGLFYNLTQRYDIPERTDLGKLPKYNSKENKQKLYGEQEGHCNGCREHFKSVNLTVDHIIARKVGGTDHISNLQLLCGYCNSVKGSFGMEYLLWKLGSNSTSKPWYKPGFPHYPTDGVSVMEQQMKVNEPY